MSSGMVNCILHSWVWLVIPSNVTLIVSRLHCAWTSVLFLNWVKTLSEGTASKVLLLASL